VILPQLKSGGTEWQTIQLLKGLATSRSCIAWIYDGSAMNTSLLAALRAIGNVEVVLGGAAALPNILKRRPKLIISYAINFYLWEVALKLLSGARLITERRNQYHWFVKERRNCAQECVRNLLTARVICNSRTVALRAAEVERFIGDKICVVPNALGIRPPEGMSDRGRVISVGNIKAGKGASQVLLAFEGIAAEPVASGVTFELFGRMDDPGVLSSVSPDAVAAFYKGERDRHGIFEGAICILHLSEAEGFPNAVLEAMAHGAVPVLSDIEVHRELFSAAAIYVSDARGARDVIEHLLAERAANPGKFEARRRKARELALGFSESRRVTAYEEIIADCLH